jgi:mannan endo-1,4-beta-mannosidase
MRVRFIQVLTALLAVVLISSPAGASPSVADVGSTGAESIGPAQPQTASHKIALGVSNLPYTSMNDYQDIKNATGRAPAVWSIWSDWGSGTANPTAFPTTLVNQLRDRGTVPLIIWQPVGNKGNTSHPLQTSCGTDYNLIINGSWDSYIHSWANAAIGKGRILLRFAHEMDGSWFAFGYTRCTNSTSKFKQMWKHVVNIFRDDGATNVKFVWSPLIATTARKSLYPGDSYVDYVGVTAFNWAGSKSRPWISLQTLISRATTGLTSFSSRPWIVAETGSVVQAGHSRSSWLKTGYNNVYASFPRVKVILYFDIDMTKRAHDQPNWRLRLSSDFSAYRSLTALSKFQGHVS